MRRIFITALAALCILSVSAVASRPARAAEREIAGEIEPRDKVLEYKGFTAIIVAPAVVTLPLSRSFPVRVQVLRVSGNEPFPQKVNLMGFGIIQSGKETGVGNLDIPLSPGGVGNAVISVPDLHQPGKNPLPIWVRDIGYEFGWMGGAEVTFRDLESIEVTQEPPKNIPTDGKSTGTFSVVVKDQYGEPLAGIPGVICMTLPLPVPREEQVVAVWTDARGAVTFTVPALARVGNALFNFEAEYGASSKQCHVHYGDAPAENDSNRYA